MCEIKKLDEKEIESKEYDQVCQDWRHRDSMLWQSVTVAITLTGVTFVVAFKGDVNPFPRFFLFLFAFLLNSLLLLKITKDHYYQVGSGELLSKCIHEKDKTEKIIYQFKKEETNPIEAKALRIREPTEDFYLKILNKMEIPFPYFLRHLCRFSTFRGFWMIQLLLVIISLAFIFIGPFLN